MKLISNDNGKNLKIDVYKTLNDIPYTLNYHVLKIKEEIDNIVTILKEYESLKEVFNNEKFNIQSYIDEFLNGIKTQATSIYKENKIANKEISKNPDLGILQEKTIQPKQDTINNEEELNPISRETRPITEAKGLKIIKPKVNSNVNLNRDPVNATDLYDMQYLEDQRRAEQEEREQYDHY